MSITVRRAAPGDETAILALILHLAIYERQPDAVHATEESLRETLFAEGAQVFAHVAEMEGVVIGIAVWFLNYSTWTGRPGLYLEDLVVYDKARGTGAGRLLFEELGREARRLGCARIDWAVLDWNESAMAFYRAIGGRPQSGWQPWRIDGEALERLGSAGDISDTFNPPSQGGGVSVAGEGGGLRDDRGLPPSAPSDAFGATSPLRGRIA